jgi:hypothetical protein
MPGCCEHDNVHVTFYRRVVSAFQGLQSISQNRK